MRFILMMSVCIVLATIGAGVVCMLKGVKTDKKQLKRILRLNSCVLAPLMLIAIAVVAPDMVLAASTEAGAAGISSGTGMGLIAMALSTGLACVGAGYAVGAVGSSALGAVAEDPSMLGKTMIFVGLAEGIAIYGIVITIMIMGKM